MTNEEVSVYGGVKSVQVSNVALGNKSCPISAYPVRGGGAEYAKRKYDISGHEVVVTSLLPGRRHMPQTRWSWFFIYLCSSFNSFLIPFAPLLPTHFTLSTLLLLLPLSTTCTPPTRRNVLSSNVPHPTHRLGASPPRLQAVCEPRTVLPPSVRLSLWRASEWGRVGSGWVSLA